MKKIEKISINLKKGGRWRGACDIMNTYNLGDGGKHGEGKKRKVYGIY